MIAVLLYLLQDFLLFHGQPVAVSYRYPFEQPFHEYSIQRKGNNVSFVKFETAAERKGVVLFFHGNMKNVEHYKQYPAFFLRNGYDVWMIDYPGFGKTTGKRTEERMYDDALFFYDFAAKELKPEQIVLYGKSMGTGVASFVATQRPSQQLILETPYYSIDALARHYAPIYPVVPLTRYSFPIHTYLPKAATPVTLIHGTDDEIIPFAQAKKLAEENKGVQLVTIKNGKHNNLAAFPEFQSTLDSLLR